MDTLINTAITVNTPTASVQFSKLDVRDYASLRGFAKQYLHTYYREVNPDEGTIGKFLVREFSKIQGKPAMIELGCGPTIHHALPAAPYVSCIDMADYLPENLEQIRLWKERDPESFHWHHYTQMILEHEGIPPSAGSIRRREELLRSRIGHLRHCDLLQEHPLGVSVQYPVVAAFFCTEEIAENKEQWRKMIRRVADMVIPGGHFFLSSLRATECYVLESEDGARESLHSVYLTENDFFDVLPSLGFPVQDIVTEAIATPELEQYGIPGTMVMSAKKTASHQRRMFRFPFFS